MRWINLIFLILIMASIAHAQAPDTLWTRTYGGSHDDYGRSLDITLEGDYVVVGETYSYETHSSEIYLLKLNPFGDTLWTRTYGGTNVEYGRCVLQTYDSGFAIVGETRSFGAGSYDIYFIKTDAQGDTLWTRTFGGIDLEFGASAFQTSDSGYVITGCTNSFGNGNANVYLIRTNPIGDTIWTRTYGDTSSSAGTSVIQTSDGNFLIAGGTVPFGADDSDVYIIKTDTFGDTLWTRTYGGGGDDFTYSLQQTSDGGYILAGFTSFGAGMTDGYLLKIDDSGDTLWTRILGEIESESILSVQQTSDDGFVLAGSTNSFGAGESDIYIIKTDSLGNVIWSGNYGGLGEDVAFSIKQTHDEMYIIAGYTTSFGAGNNDVYIMKLLSEPTHVYGIGSGPELDHFVLHSNYPNPFNVSTTIEYGLSETKQVRIDIYDIIGRQVRTLIDGYVQAGVHTVTFDASHLSSGVYFYQLWAGDAVETKRMLLLK